MILILSILLYVSVLGMLGIILTKRYESRTGHILLSSIRPQVADTIHAIGLFVLHKTPVTARRLARHSNQYVRVWARHIVASSILWTEQKLERVLHVMRHTATQAPQSQLALSPFLREVAEHKKTLMRRAPARRRIVSQE